jgi:hypothetical protein
LETICAGGRTYTSHEALARFLERVTEAKSGQQIPTRTNRQREAQRRAALRKLEAEGLIDTQQKN